MRAHFKTARRAGLKAAEALLGGAAGLWDHTQHVEAHGLGQRPVGMDMRAKRKFKNSIPVLKHVAGIQNGERQRKCGTFMEQ